MISGEHALFEARMLRDVRRLELRAMAQAIAAASPRIGWAMADVGRAATTTGEAFARFMESLAAAARGGTTTVAELRRMQGLRQR